MKQRRYKQGVLVVHARKRSPLRLDPSRTGAIRKAFVKELAKRFAKLKLALRKLIVDEDALGLKEAPKPLVGNQSTPAPALLDVPDIRQPNHFYCGASATFAVTQFFQVGAKTLEETARILGTNVEQSTHPQAIIDYLTSLGLTVEPRGGMTVVDLAHYHARSMPVICPVQDYGNRREAGASFAYGHYLTVIGVGMGNRIFCQDSSIENVERVPGGDVPKYQEEDSDNIAEPGRIMVEPDRWMEVWHDKDIDGNKFIRYGIAVGKPGAPPGDTAGLALDLLGGVVPADLDRARDVDFVTLPLNVQGTNCGNCRFVDYGYSRSTGESHGAFCMHPRVRFAVNDRCCCALWDAKGTLRHFEDVTANVEKECPLDPEECDEEQWIEGSSTRTKATGVQGHSIILDNTRWKFATDPAKLKRFAEWLRASFGKDLTSPDAEALWQRYAEEGFRKGAGRAFDDTRKAEKALTEGDQAKLDFYAGSREEFLRSAFGRPETVEKVQLLAARSFSELDGVTDAMEQRMTRVLADGLVQGKGPMEIARDLDDEVDIGRNRAEAIARTEIIRAHAEGQLDALENLGVEEVGVAVEFTVTDDEALCERCAALEGVVLKIEEAHGLIPVHVNCRCSFIPANVGEDDEGQKDTKRDIDAALAEADIDDVEVSTSRPQSILNQLRDLLANEAGEVPEQEEGAPETVEVVRRRARKGKTIGVLPPANDEDVIKAEGQVGPESLDKHVAKQDENEKAPPRN